MMTATVLLAALAFSPEGEEPPAAAPLVTTEMWEAFADDGGPVDVEELDLVEVHPGTVFTVGTCGMGVCRVLLSGRDLWAFEDSWIAEPLP